MKDREERQFFSPVIVSLHAKYLMRNLINIITENLLEDNPIKTHMRDCIMAGKHYEGGFNGRKHFTESMDKWLMAEQWHSEGLLQSDSPDDPEFPALLDEWIDKRYDYVVSRLDDLPHEHGYHLLRVIRVSPEWLDDFPKRSHLALGEYWTYDPDDWEPNAPWANPNMQGFDITITAIAPESGVNWDKTIMANMDFYSGDYESEMRLLPNTPLEIIEIRLGDRLLDHRGKTFVV